MEPLSNEAIRSNYFFFLIYYFVRRMTLSKQKKKRFLKSKQGSFFVRCCFCINLFSLPWKKSEKKTGYSIFRIKYKKKALLCHAHANRIIIFRCVSNSRIYIIIIFQQLSQYYYIYSQDFRIESWLYLTRISVPNSINFKNFRLFFCGSCSLFILKID